MTEYCSNCKHEKSKHAFDIVVTQRENPCELSCLVCFDLETERLKKAKELKKQLGKMQIL